MLTLPNYCFNWRIYRKNSKNIVIPRNVGNKIKKKLERGVIKSELIRSCINNEPKSFIPFLLSKEVKTGMPNKIRFYTFFKKIVNCSSNTLEGKLFFKIEQPDWIKDKNIVYYNFYDTIHEHSRISIEITETENSIFLNTLTF